MKHSLTIKNLDGLAGAASEFKEVLKSHRLIAFYAPMGAGKTTFTKAVCESLGVPSEEISSPTFSIVNEYVGDDGCSIYHFDFYRITKDAEALDIGLYDYLDSGCPCLMEWPENIENLLPEDTLKVTIHVKDDGTREVCWED